MESVAHITKVLEASKFSYEVIFVEDKSSDNTADLVYAAVAKHKKFRAIFHRVNQGRGASVGDGIKAAKGSTVGFIDIDCEVSPVYIPEMVSMILAHKADVVVGNRIYRTSLSSIPREVLSRGYRRLCDIMFDTEGIDTESGYKFFHRKKILPVLCQAQHPGWFWDTEIIVLGKRAGLAIVEMPVFYERRRDKTSSVHVAIDTVDYVRSLFALRGRLRST